MLRNLLLFFLLVCCISYGETSLRSGYSNTSQVFLVDILSSEIGKRFNLSHSAVSCKLLDNGIENQITKDNIVLINLTEINQEKGTFQATLKMRYGHYITVSGTYKLSILLPCLNKNVKSNYFIKANDVECKVFSTYYFDSELISISDDLIGKVATRNISKFHPIKKYVLSKPILIDIGDRVKIVYRVKSLVLAKPGISISKGVLGDIIKIRDEKDKNNIMDCKIIDRQTVEIQ